MLKKQWQSTSREHSTAVLNLTCAKKEKHYSRLLVMVIRIVEETRNTRVHATPLCFLCWHMSLQSHE